MDRKQLISFAIFTIPTLMLVYKTIPEAILPVCGLLMTYLAIDREGMKNKRKSKTLKAENNSTKINSEDQIAASKILRRSITKNNL